MTTIIFFAVVLIISAYIFRGWHRSAWNSIAGYKKVDGEMVQVAQPDHYTASGVLFAYWTGAGVTSVLFYLCVAFVFDMSGLSAKFSIHTGFACVMSIFK